MISLAAVLLGCASTPSIPILHETALIVYNRKECLQWFIRGATFQPGKGVPHFGFLVPTPSLPEVKPVKKELFGELSRLLPSYSPGMGGGGFGGGGGRTSPVVESGEVGAFKYDVLQAAHNGVASWFRQNGFSASSAMGDWISPYARSKAYVTAFRIDRKGKGTVDLAPVRLGFDTDRPFYPYREPQDARPATARLLRLWVLDEGPVTTDIRAGKSVKLGEKSRKRLVDMLGFDPGDSNVLTQFVDETRVRPDKDLFFDLVPESGELPLAPEPGN